MKKTLFTALLALSAMGVTAQSYKLDAFHTNARFEIDHFGTSTNAGGFYGLNGTVEWDASKRTGAIDIKIPVASLQTNAQAFTTHLLSPSFFNAEKFPEMRFQSKKFHFSGNKVKAVQGELTLLGKTLPVTLKANKFNCYQSPKLKTEVCGGDFTTIIDRTKWGMNGMVDIGITKNVKLIIQVEAAKQ